MQLRTILLASAILATGTLLSNSTSGQSPIVISPGHLDDTTQRLREWRTDPRLKKFTDNVKGIDEFLKAPKLPLTGTSQALADAYRKDNQPNNAKLEEMIKAIELFVQNTKLPTYPPQIKQLQDMVDSRIQALVGANPDELKETRIAVRAALASIAAADGTYAKDKAVEKLTAIATELKALR